MSAVDMSNALFGLQGMTSNSESVRYILNLLILKMKESDDIYTGRDIGKLQLPTLLLLLLLLALLCAVCFFRLTYVSYLVCYFFCFYFSFFLLL